MSKPQYMEHLPSLDNRLERQKHSHPPHQCQLLLPWLWPQPIRLWMFSSVANFSAWHHLILETPGKTEQRWDMWLLSNDHYGINKEISEEFLLKTSHYPCTVLPTSLLQLCLTHWHVSLKSSPALPLIQSGHFTGTQSPSKNKNCSRM